MTLIHDRTSAEPFANESFLDSAFGLLAIRVKRISAERELYEAEMRERGDPNTVGRTHRVADEDAARRATMLREVEEEQRQMLDARLEAHRADPDAPTLGIDRLTQKHGLSPDERMVLLSALSYAVSEQMSEDIHGDLGVGMYGSATVEGLMRLLDAKTVGDRLRARRIFAPAAPLVKGGLIVLDFYRGGAHPEDVIGARTKISDTAFDVLVGNGPALTVLP